MNEIGILSILRNYILCQSHGQFFSLLQTSLEKWWLICLCFKSLDSWKIMNQFNDSNDSWINSNWFWENYNFVPPPPPHGHIIPKIVVIEKWKKMCRDMVKICPYGIYLIWLKSVQCKYNGYQTDNINKTIFLNLEASKWILKNSALIF